MKGFAVLLLLVTGLSFGSGGASSDWHLRLKPQTDGVVWGSVGAGHRYFVHVRWKKSIRFRGRYELSRLYWKGSVSSMVSMGYAGNLTFSSPAPVLFDPASGDITMGGKNVGRWMGHERHRSRSRR